MDLPEPLATPDLDLRSFRWMKLDLLALFNSDFNTITNDAAWRAGVTLWGKAWHQVPAGSLPNDDTTLCSLAGLGRDLRTWRKIKSQAMHGFTLCSDGRYYHGFLCEMARDAFTGRQRYETRKAADRQRKREKNSSGIPTPVPAEFHRKTLLEGEREKEREDTPSLRSGVCVAASPKPAPPPAVIEPDFVVIPILGNEEFHVGESVVADYERTYPGVDIRQQLREMRRWAIDNPTLRKTRRGMPRFMNQWLAKEQDRLALNGTRHGRPAPIQAHLAGLASLIRDPKTGD